jgi:hypothetical protein
MRLRPSRRRVHSQTEIHHITPVTQQSANMQTPIAGKKGISANLLLPQWNIYVPKEDSMLPLVLACLTALKVQ